METAMPMMNLTDDMIRDLRDEATYPGEIYTKCQRALGAYGEPCSEARADLTALCRSLAGYLADHGDADLSRERVRFARLLDEWKRS